MNALTGYGSSSDDSDTDAPAAPAPAAATPTARHDDGGLLGESESEDEEVGATAAVSAASGLPSAASLLDGAGPRAAWLDKPDWATAPREPAVVPTPVAPRQTQAAAAADAAREAQEGDYGHDMYQRYDPARGWVGKQPHNIEHDDSRGYGGHLAQARGRPPPEQRVARPSSFRMVDNAKPHLLGGKPAAKRDKGDRATGKERVKQQRLNGQSGIGDHFKVWRSEEEMRLRQTYD